MRLMVKGRHLLCHTLPLFACILYLMMVEWTTTETCRREIMLKELLFIHRHNILCCRQAELLTAYVNKTKINKTFNHSFENVKWVRQHNTVHCFVWGILLLKLYFIVDICSVFCEWNLQCDAVFGTPASPINFWHRSFV